MSKISTQLHLAEKAVLLHQDARDSRLALMESLAADQLRKSLPPDTTIIPLTKGEFTIIDMADFEQASQFHWALHGEGYAVTRNQITGHALMHRWISGAKKGEVCDHRNRNRLDNRRSNLRLCNYTQNGQYCEKRMPYGTSKSRFKGVCTTQLGNLKPWRAYYSINRTQISLGTFETEVEAALAYNTAALEHFGEFALLNVI